MFSPELPSSIYASYFTGLPEPPWRTWKIWVFLVREKSGNLRKVLQVRVKSGNIMFNCPKEKLFVTLVCCFFLNKWNINRIIMIGYGGFLCVEIHPFLCRAWWLWWIWPEPSTLKRQRVVALMFTARSLENSSGKSQGKYREFCSMKSWEPLFSTIHWAKMVWSIIIRRFGALTWYIILAGYFGYKIGSFAFSWKRKLGQLFESYWYEG